jgi:hypothetical protein
MRRNRGMFGLFAKNERPVDIPGPAVGRYAKGNLGGRRRRRGAKPTASWTKGA